MDCLNSPERKYDSFDVENMQQDQGGAPGAAANSSRPTSQRSSRLPLLLSAAALVCALTGLALGAYATHAARQLSQQGGEGAFLTARPGSVPRGWQAVSLFPGYFAAQRPMLYARSDHKTLPIGNTVYLIGGLSNGVAVDAAERGVNSTAARAAVVPRVLNRTTAYDTYAGTATPLADMPQPRFRFCGAVLDGALYVVGGMAAFEAADATKHVVSDRVMRYSPAANKWEVLPGRLNHPRGDCCAASVAGKLVVAGGWTTDYSDTLGSAEVFDPARGSWELLRNNLTMPRGDCEAAAVDDRTMLVIGGVDTAGNFTASVEALDMASDTPSWSARASMLKPRGDFAAEVLPGGRVIVMGGETSNGTATEHAMYEVEEYSVSGDTWTTKAPLPEARFRFDTAHVKDRVYIFGGHPTCSGKADASKRSCVAVALDSVYGYFDSDAQLYAVVKQA